MSRAQSPIGEPVAVSCVSKSVAATWPVERAFGTELAAN